MARLQLNISHGTEQNKGFASFSFMKKNDKINGIVT